MHAESVQHPGLTDRKIADVNHLLDFAMSFYANLSHFHRHKIAERFLQFAQGIAEIANDFPALGCWYFTPLKKNLLRHRSDLFISLWCCLDNLGKSLPRGWVV